MTDADTIPEASDDRSLALILDGSRMLAEARDLFAVRHVRALAVAATAYAKARDLGADAIRQASTIVILATERLGEEIAAGQEAGTIATAGGSPILRAAEDRPATLADLGITANLAAASQRLAADPAAVDAYLTRRDVMPTMRGALRAVAGVEPVDALLVAVDADDAADLRADRVRELFGHLERVGVLLAHVVPLSPEEVEGVRLNLEIMAAELPPAPVAARRRPSTPDLHNIARSSGASDPAGRVAGATDDDLPEHPPCPDTETYRAHQSSHYRKSGWGCHACEAEVTS